MLAWQLLYAAGCDAAKQQPHASTGMPARSIGRRMMIDWHGRMQIFEIRVCVSLCAALLIHVPMHPLQADTLGRHYISSSPPQAVEPVLRLARHSESC